MNRNKLSLLAILGLVGLLGIFTNNPGMYGFFGFFGFAAFSAVKNDEMMEKNAARAGLNAFVVCIVGLVAALVSVSIVQSMLIATAFIAGIFAIGILTFTISFVLYEKKGDVQ